MVVRRRGDGASPAEEQEVHGDDGAPTSGGTDSARRPAAPRAADLAGQRVPAFTCADDLRACSTPAAADWRPPPLLLFVPHRDRPPPPPMAASTAGCSWWGTERWLPAMRSASPQKRRRQTTWTWSTRRSSTPSSRETSSTLTLLAFKKRSDQDICLRRSSSQLQEMSSTP
nr:uncharacterized protein LOC127330806 [Lolium perenne]